MFSNSFGLWHKANVVPENDYDTLKNNNNKNNAEPNTKQLPPPTNVKAKKIKAIRSQQDYFRARKPIIP